MRWPRRAQGSRPSIADFTTTSLPDIVPLLDELPSIIWRAAAWKGIFLPLEQEGAPPDDMLDVLPPASEADSVWLLPPPHLL